MRLRPMKVVFEESSGCLQSECQAVDTEFPVGLVDVAPVPKHGIILKCATDGE